MRFSSYLLHFSHIGDTIRGQKHHPGNIKKHNVFCFPFLRNMLQYGSPKTFIWELVSKQNRQQIDTGCTKSPQVPKKDQRATLGIHISRCFDQDVATSDPRPLHIMHLKLNNKSKKHPKCKELQKTLHPIRASQTQSNFEVWRCRVSVLNCNK